ncbi:hypothetical protein ELH92_18945 [Rhizobium ruizarguesonis]|uniref:nucleoid-associated protein n=1 Tax=Rhizobium ruizarguesonis TaxID=2081791 RepID=UPI00103011EB|nr:nucleoid-associated protein [Rhizobium ruizarguesonis]TAY23182.1 hypothetical protein ELH92_18945 [Rhizobium ruizarguesonis]
MGFFNDEELQSLRIENMILHVVSENDFEPQRARPVEHGEFFLDRIKDTDAAAIFEFTGDSRSKLHLERIAAGDVSFETGAQEVSRLFALLHDRTSRAGAFFVFELRTNDDRVRLYSLIKYDYQQVIEQAPAGDDGSLLRLILQAFVAQKRAVQKSALVRVVDGVAEAAISAKDRMMPGIEIADYFARFLQVRRTRSDEELTRTVRNLLRTTLDEIRPHLPDQDVARAFRRVTAALRDRAMINGEVISEVVIAAAEGIGNEELTADVQKRVARKLRSAKLEGLTFPPDRNVLRLPPLRRVTTTEGVVLLYPDGADKAIVERERLGDGGEKITIRTAHVTEDKVVREGIRKPN